MHSLLRTAHRNTTVPTQIPMCSPSDVTQQQTQIPAYRRSVVIATELLSNEQTKHFREKPPRMAVADRLLSYTTPPNTDSGVQSFTYHSTGSASVQPGHVKAAAHRNTTLPTQIPMRSPSDMTQQIPPSPNPIRGKRQLSINDYRCRRDWTGSTFQRANTAPPLTDGATNGLAVLSNEQTPHLCARYIHAYTHMLPRRRGRTCSLMR